MPGALPSFDNAVVAVLGLAGIGGSVLAVVAFALALQSWYDGVRLIGRAGGAVRRAAVVGPAAGVAGVLGAALVPVAQVLCLGLCYLGGNYLSIVVDDDREARGMRLGDLFVEHGAGALWPSRLAEGLELDRIAGAYLVVALACVVLSYVFATTGDDVLVLALVMGVPALLTLVLAALALAVLAAVALVRLAWLLVTAVFADADFRDWLQDQTIMLPFLGVALLCLLYVWSCYAALAASRIPVEVMSGE